MNDNLAPIVEAEVLSYYDSPIELNREVNDRLQRGWELYFAPSVIAVYDRRLIYTQMIVKRSTRDIKPSSIPNEADPELTSHRPGLTY